MSPDLPKWTNTGLSRNRISKNPLHNHQNLGVYHIFRQTQIPLYPRYIPTTSQLSQVVSSHSWRWIPTSSNILYPHKKDEVQIQGSLFPKFSHDKNILYFAHCLRFLGLICLMVTLWWTNIVRTGKSTIGHSAIDYLPGREVFSPAPRVLVAGVVQNIDVLGANCPAVGLLSFRWIQSWGFPARHVGTAIARWLVGLLHGKSQSNKWMMTGGTPISGNLHIIYSHLIVLLFPETWWFRSQLLRIETERKA